MFEISGCVPAQPR